jgi:MFS superfamily sulfate permease-like transporter
VRAIILDASRINDVDYTAAKMLLQLRSELAKREIRFASVAVSEGIRTASGATALVPVSAQREFIGRWTPRSRRSLRNPQLIPAGSDDRAQEPLMDHLSSAENESFGFDL